MSNRITVTDLINDSVKINPEARRAIAAFRSSKPWQGSFDERFAKFTALCQALGNAYGIAPVLEFKGKEDMTRLGDGAINREGTIIRLVGKLSVVTFLNCFARARGKTPKECYVWSLSVFKRMFPVSFARCHVDGINLIR